MSAEKKPLYVVIARLLMVHQNCVNAGNLEWMERHEARIASLVKEHMPSGSGFDQGTTLDESSTPERLRFNTSFHHMDDSGGYCGWTEHVVSVRASIPFGIVLHISGRNVRDVKEYMHAVFRTALETLVQKY